MKYLRALMSAVWEHEDVTVPGLVMARRVTPAGPRRFLVQLDVQFEHLGQRHQATVQTGEFPDAGEARQSLERWAIGSGCRLRFPTDRPEAVELVSRG